MSETTYTIENAKSGRSKCKKCKGKIEKGEHRIGIHSPGPGDYSMSSWCKPECFTLPRKLVKEGVTPLTFVKEHLMDETDDHNLSDIEEQIIQAIESKPSKAPKSQNGATTGGKIEKIKNDLDKIRKADDVDEAVKPKKKAKRETNGKQDKSTLLSEIDVNVAKVYEIYERDTNDQLKDVLRWNRQLVSGTKDILLQRTIDGHMNGRLGSCPSCLEGKLKLKDDGETVFCNGYFDEDAMARIPCFHSCKQEEAARLKPWFTKKPTDEVIEEMDKNNSKSGNEEGTAKFLSELTSNAQKMQDEGNWNLDSKAAVKATNKAMFNLCVGKLDLPSDAKKATMEIGKLILLDRKISAVEFAKVLADKFGFVKENEEAQKRKTKTLSAACNHDSNGRLMLL